MCLISISNKIYSEIDVKMNFGLFLLCDSLKFVLPGNNPQIYKIMNIENDLKNKNSKKCFLTKIPYKKYNQLSHLTNFNVNIFCSVYLKLGT